MQLVPPIAARAATKFSELVVCRALLAISYRLTAQNFFAKCEEVTDKDSIRKYPFSSSSRDTSHLHIKVTE